MVTGRVVSVLFFSFTALSSLSANAQQTAALDPISIGSRLAEQGEAAAKLAEIETILQELQGSQNADIGLYFELSELRLELLIAEDRKPEAAALAAQLAQIAISQRQTLNRDPVPFLRHAAALYEATGNLRNAAAALNLELKQRLEGGQSGEKIAFLQRERARIAELQGNSQLAEDYEKLAQNALSPDAGDTRANDKQGFREVDVFYATDRTRTGENEPSDFYGYGRGELEYGIVSVTIPDIHVPGAIESPSIWRLEFGPEPTKHIMVQKVDPLEPDTYFQRMQAELEKLKRKEAFVFIHGFNSSFDAAAKRAAQLAYDMDYRGVPVLYSWPSAGKTFMYVADTAVVRLSGRRLYVFLQELRSRSGADVVHIVAHSMGNRALTDALELLAMSQRAEEMTEPMFGQIFFAAPDVDAGLFREMLGTIHPLAQRLTLYTSKEDWALVASRKLHGDAPRAGQAGADLVTSKDFDTVDMSALGEDMLAHTYFANDSSALADIMSLIWLNVGPERRCGLDKSESTGGSSYWKYTKGICPDADLISVIKLMWQQQDISADEIRENLRAKIDDSERLSNINEQISKLLPDENK